MPRRYGSITVEMSSPEKVLFPRDGITKADLADYYGQVADIMLPHVRNPAATVQRFPTNQACLTPHVWLSRIDRLHYPDRLIFDLDSSGRDFAPVVAAARALRDVLEELGLVPYLMTTGSRGLHVVTPLDRSADFDAARAFAWRVARVVAARAPDRWTTEQRKDKRRGRVFFDTMRNAYGQMAVAPYAVRALPGAPVAAPVDWAKLGRLTGAGPFTIKNIVRRLARRGDPWEDIARHARAIADSERIESASAKAPARCRRSSKREDRSLAEERAHAAMR